MIKTLRSSEGEELTVYACNSCGNKMSEDDYAKIDQTLLAVQTNIDKVSFYYFKPFVK